MTDMIERVARALAAYYEDDRFERCIPQAILAIKAMRNPTEDMSRYGEYCADECYKGDPCGKGAPHIWQTMIDAALKGTEQ